MAFIDTEELEDNAFPQPCSFVMEKYNRDIRDVGYQDLITLNEIHVVWYQAESKDGKLHNWRALVTTDRKDGRYYELTHNADLGNTVLEVYSKDSKEIIPDASR